MVQNTPKRGPGSGNKNGLKLKDPSIRQLAYAQYCEHLAKGKSKKSWYFEHPEFRCTWETIEKYLDDDIEFDPLHKKIAEAKGFAYWEGVVEDSATGKNKDANTASIQMLMRNKYAWDKPSAIKEVSVDPTVTKQFDAVMSQITSIQDSRSQNRG